MARSSKKADRAAVSALLFVVIIGLVLLAVAAIRHGNWHTGTKYIAWAFLPLMILLGFTPRVQCRVKTALQRQLAADFEQHPDAPVARSLPGPGPS